MQLASKPAPCPHTSKPSSPQVASLKEGDASTSELQILGPSQQGRPHTPPHGPSTRDPCAQVANLKEGKASSSELQGQLAGAQRSSQAAAATAQGLERQLAAVQAELGALQREAGGMQQTHAAALASLHTQNEERLSREAGGRAQAQAELCSLASQAEEERARGAAALAQVRAELGSLRSYAEVGPPGAGCVLLWGDGTGAPGPLAAQGVCMLCHSWQWCAARRRERGSGVLL